MRQTKCRTERPLHIFKGTYLCEAARPKSSKPRKTAASSPSSLQLIRTRPRKCSALAFPASCSAKHCWLKHTTLVACLDALKESRRVARAVSTSARVPLYTAEEVQTNETSEGPERSDIFLYCEVQHLTQKRLPRRMQGRIAPLSGPQARKRLFPNETASRALVVALQADPCGRGTTQALSEVKDCDVDRHYELDK